MAGMKVDDTLLEADFLVIGSGYGGAVAAMRLASGAVDGPGGPDNPIPSVVVLERGREYGLGDFPYDIEDLPSHIRMVRPGSNASGYSDALFNLHVGVENTDPQATQDDRDKGRDTSAADVLVGSGLGGTSLINANVAEQPAPHVFRKKGWPRQFHDTPDLLDDAFVQVADRIGVTTHTASSGQDFPKYSALQRLGSALGYDARPANIAVTTRNPDSADATVTNKVGVEQSPCTDCGNCVTGCNVGAKNTLDRNLLRLAKSRGAEFYTGATVQRIEPLAPQDIDNGYRWKVILRPTVKPTAKPRGKADDPVNYDTYCILARNVILAAGALGSTEILLRSQQANHLEFSTKLGQKFSTNGDGIIMSYGQENRVGSIAQAAQKSPTKAVGPTITGIIRTEKLSIEEASIPAPLARVFSELVTTSAMLQRISKRKLPSMFEQAAHDPLAAPLSVADHCQALLIMGDDGANGQLSLQSGQQALNIAFPSGNISDNDALTESNRLLQQQDRKAGLDGGQYAPNPLWQLMPPEATEVLSGSMPARRVLTVHPLGGCAMADDVTGGVVNHRGQVFRRDGQLYEGLFVLDGAIIPTALEVNPFLTIAALAWRNVGLILSEAADTGRAQVLPEYADLGEVPHRHRDTPQPTEFVIQEQLTGKLDALTPWFKRHLGADEQARLLGRDGLVVQVEAASEEGERWLDNPGAAPLQASMQLYTNPMGLEELQLYNPVGVPPARMKTIEPFMTLKGSFTVFVEDPYCFLTDIRGFFRAYFAYRKRRGGVQWLSAAGVKAFLRNPCASIKNAYSSARVFFNIGAMQSRYRRLSYVFTDQASGVSIKGEKVLGYSLDIKRMWDGLLNLEIEVKQADGSACCGQLGVNAESLLEPGLVEIRKSANLPQSLLFAGGLAGFVARSLFSTNFWEFGGLEYLEAERDRPTPVALATRTSGAVAPEAPVFFDVPVREGSDKSIPLRLTRYRREGAKPLLMLHGLAQGSQIYWMEGITNLAAYFYDAGFDVWLLDYRLSNLVLPNLSLEDRKWSMDEIAMFDIPAAIRKVCELTHYEKILVFGHCVGACSLAMATLKDKDIGERIEAAVTNAIHPWVISSPGNRFRAKFGNFYREWVAEESLEPNPQQGAGGLQNLMDRLAFGLSRINEQEEDDHSEFGGSELAQSICDRMTFLYGRMWNHKNLAPETHEAFIQMLGPAPASVYQHLYYYSSLRRITDQNGENTYLTGDNIANNWRFPILFIHGNDSRVFNPHSARRSATRLHGILNGTPPSSGGASELDEKIAVRYKIYPDYGHMDVIFGEKAHETCFQDYVDFLQDPGSFKNPENESDWREPYIARPLIGPVLRAAWDSDNKIYLRLWSELRTNVTYQPEKLLVEGALEVAEFELEVASPAAVVIPRFRMIDVAIENINTVIELSLRGKVQNHGQYDGAELEYTEQSWLHRLRARCENRHQPRMCFIVGSCRYPGSLVDNALSDKVYAAIQQHTTSAQGAQLLFLIGDQIYADATDQLVEMKSLKAKYSDRYRRAFGYETSPHFARLVEQIPTHFALDDHEKGDDWSGLPSNEPATPDDDHDYATTMATRFLGSGRSQAPILGDTVSSQHYYALSQPQECDFPTFITDTRSERQYRHSNDPVLHRLMADQQYEALTDWLLDAHQHCSDAPKFIVSGSIIAPLSTRYVLDPSTWRHQDGWAGYPRTMEKLLLFIAKNRIEKVVFLGGDAHLSAVAKLNLKVSGEEPGISVWQIVSSGLYAPLPFANAHVEDFIWFEAHALPVHVEPSLSIECTNTLLSDHYSQFVRVEADSRQVSVTSYDETNAVLATQDLF